jgi:hypothetical protein
MSSVLTQHEREALMRAGPRLCGVWGLSEDITARLLSDDKDDQLERIGALVAIHVALMVILGGDVARVQKWLSAPNQAPSMEGMSAIQAMIQGGLPAMVRIRRHLEAEVAG